LETGIPAFDLVLQGGRYFLDSLLRDPVTLLAIFTALVFALTAKNKKLIALAVGGIVYLFYVLKIGGDFMSGRFFTPLFFAGVAILSQISDPAKIKKFAALVLAFAAIGWGIHFSGSSIATENINSFGISDERKFFESENSVIGVIRLGGIENHSWGAKKQGDCSSVRLFWNVGIFGYFSPRECHIVDGYALTDPFLARLPVDQNWRIGHFDRSPPTGYLESLSANQNLLADIDLQNLFAQIQLVTRAPLFSRDRWAAIWELNF
jgi:arabinofuranosyltransferase